MIEVCDGEGFAWMCRKCGRGCNGKEREGKGRVTERIGRFYLEVLR